MSKIQSEGSKTITRKQIKQHSSKAGATEKVTPENNVELEH